MDTRAGGGECIEDYIGKLTYPYDRKQRRNEEPLDEN